MVCSLQLSLFSVTGNINVQFLLGDNENGVFEGTYNITFGIYPSPNMEESQALWTETHDLIITQGKVSQILGTKTALDYHLFKSDKLYFGLSFEELSDRVFVPLISVPAAVVSKYSVYAREIEYTADWMKVNTQNHRVGIGITQNLTVPFQVVGSANITSVNATGELHSPDGYNIHQLDYLKLVNLDDYSLSPYDGFNTPTVDVVYVTNERNVGVGIYDVSQIDINAQLHVSGNLKVDEGNISGRSDLYFVGTANAVSNFNTTGDPSPKLIWDSNKSVFRAGFSSGDKWDINRNGNYSAAFGSDNQVSGEYGFSAGQDNIVKKIHGIAFGKSNHVEHSHSGILGGASNLIYLTSEPTTGGYMTIGGGMNNKLKGDYGFIGGGSDNEVLDDSEYASIVGGKKNIINASSDYSVILSGENNQIWGAHSIAMGKNAQIGASGTPHDGVFMFADSTVQGTAPLQSSYPNQFVVHATNGILFGLSGFDHKADLVIDEFSPSKTYPPGSELVKPHTIRTAGDIVAADGDGKLGYLVGDGTFITNVSSVWKSKNNTIFAPTQRIAVGVDYENGDSSYPDDTRLYLKGSSDYHSNIRIESINGGLLDVGVNGSDSVIESNNQLLFKRSGTDIFEITNNDEVYFKFNVGINKPNPNVALDVDGSARITGGLESTSGTITANAFVGNGSEISNLQVSYMVPNKNGAKHLVMSNEGRVAIGQVALDYYDDSSSNSVDALLHIGSSSNATPHIRLDGSDSSNAFTTMTSDGSFDLTFHNYDNETDKIFFIKSKKDATEKSLVRVTAKGHVGILMDPPGEDALSVSGNVWAKTFEGNGRLLTAVQLDSKQTKSVIFEQTTTFETMVKLKPRNHDDPPSCTITDVGSIYSIYSGTNNSGPVAICACIDENNQKNLTGPDDEDCK